MDAREAIQLLRTYAKCPKCGNELLGNGEGTLTIEVESFERTCKCGWSVKRNSP